MATHSSLRRTLLVLTLALVPGALIAIRAQNAPPPHDVTLTPAEAKRLAAEERAAVSVQMPEGVELSVYAPEPLVEDPVALKFDASGTMYVASTERANLPLDIREHADWVPVVHTLKTVPDLLAFYRRDLAPERSAQNGWIPDANADGSHDYRDFAAFKERVVRLRDTDGDGIADQSRLVFEGLNEEPVYDVIGGLLPYGGDLYVGSAPGVWRLRDDDKDGKADGQVTISEGYGVHMAFGGHGISGLMMGPDGRLYWEVGDIGLDVVDKDGKRWSLPNQGAVMRSELDGTGFEVFATGIRNLQEFAFDEHANLVSVDNDGDHAGESERVVYITEGSDAGWRSNWQYGKFTDPRNNRYNVWMDEEMYKPRQAGQPAHIVPPVASHHAGPSGMVYNPGTALSPEWRRHFFVSSFPGAPANARIYAFTLKPDGAGFALDRDVSFLRGILTIGMDIGPDGALYITDWINGWSANNNGRIWKLDTPATAGSAERREVQALIAEPFDARPVGGLATLLGHADMRVRQKAQFELARRSEAGALAEAAKGGQGLARLHGIWGLGQLARKSTGGQPAAPLVALLKDGDAEVRTQAARTLGDVRHAGAADGLVALLKDPEPRPRYYAAEALGRLAHKPAVAPIVEMLAANDDRDVYLRHAGALALARIGDVQALAALNRHASRGVRLAAIIALRRLRQPEVALFLGDGDPALVTEAARAINDDGSIRAALPALARVLEGGKAQGEPLLRRAISANLKVGDADAVRRLAAFAKDASQPEAMRVEAIAVLGVWPQPSPLDRVDGMHLEPGIQDGPRDAAAAREALLPLVTATGASPAVKIALAQAAGRLELTQAAPVLLGQLRADPSVEVRVASLRALQAMRAPSVSEAMAVAVADAEPAVRRAALELLPSMELSDAAKADHLATVIRNGTVEDKQAGFEVLGSLKSVEAQRVLNGFVDELAKGSVPVAAQLDLVDAVQASGAPALVARLEAYQKAQGAETLLAAFRPALLAGGNPNTGRALYLEHPAAQCTRCHSLRAGGSDVGPNLNQVGVRLSAEQLLQSMLEPSAVVAPGYGTVTLTLKNGDKVSGTLKSESASQVVLTVGDPPVERTIPKAEIASRTDPISAMPPMGALLKPREIRDIVAFLGTLKY